MQLTSLVSLALVAASAIAAPPFAAGNKKLQIGNLAGLPAPTKDVSYILLGVGTQNYTCAAQGTYASAGAVAEVYDISCADKPAEISSAAFNLWKDTPSGASVGSVIQKLPKEIRKPKAGDHYFEVTTAGAAARPKWDFSSALFKGNADAIVYGAKNASVAAPSGKADVDWLYLLNTGGKLADEIYRTETHGGQPPASCSAGESTTVKYTTLYYLTGGSIKKN